MFRRFAPKSLYARVVLIIILPVFFMQAVLTYIFFARHWDLVTANLSRSTAGQIAFVTRLYEEAETRDERDQLFAWTQENMDMAVQFDEGALIPPSNQFSVFNLYNQVFEARVRGNLDKPYWINTKSWPNFVEIRVQLDDGALEFLVLRDRVFATSGPIFLLWLVVTSILLGWIAITFLRNQVRSILRLAHAAEDFGRGRDDPEFRPSGAMEVRRAGRAFIAMRERIRRHIDQRTTMLAGVSHDLRTPLTRLKLALAFTPDDEELTAMRADVEEMDNMVQAYLDFASDLASTEELVSVDMAALAQEVLDEADPDNAQSALETKSDRPGDLIMEARRNVLKRALANLVSNALKYADHVWVRVQRTGVHIEVIVEDNGPGISPENYNDAFKPFERLDQARSHKKPGVGLGLSVVRDAARSHGGEVVLTRAAQGGLKVTFRTPV